MITSIGRMELSRATVLMMLASDAEDAREHRAREEAAAQHGEESVARAQAYFREHGEWEWVTRAREADLAARREQAEFDKRERERAELRQTRYAQLIAEGHRPRTVAEILSVAALYP